MSSVWAIYIYNPGQADRVAADYVMLLDWQENTTTYAMCVPFHGIKSPTELSFRS